MSRYQIGGWPLYLKVAYVAQELIDSDMTVLNYVVASDQERTGKSLLKYSHQDFHLSLLFHCVDCLIVNSMVIPYVDIFIF